MGPVPLQKRSKGTTWPLPSVKDSARSHHRWGMGPHQIWNLPALWSWTSQSPELWANKSLIYKSLSVWQFVIAAWADGQTPVGHWWHMSTRKREMKKRPSLKKPQSEQGGQLRTHSGRAPKHSGRAAWGQKVHKLSSRSQRSQDVREGKGILSLKEQEVLKWIVPTSQISSSSKEQQHSKKLQNSKEENENKQSKDNPSLLYWEKTAWGWGQSQRGSVWGAQEWGRGMPTSTDFACCATGLVPLAAGQEPSAL